MKLTKLKIKNFRCYQAETIFVIDELTSIIGKNDIGKSTLLEALDGFFNDNIDQSDLSNSAEGNTVELTCYFDNIKDEIVLDTSTLTQPNEEGILNEDNQLEIVKHFNFGSRKTTAVFLNAYYPDDERIKLLLSKKNTPLKSLAEELGVDLEGVNKRKNPPIRQRIREHIGGSRSMTLLKVDGNIDNEDNLKAVWSSLKKMLPIYSLFKVDKSLNDKDGDIKDPMQVAINEALALPEIQSLLEQIETKVKEASTEVADKTIEKLKEFDESLSERLKSDFTKAPSYNRIFDLTLLNENNIPLNKRGSGIRRLVLLSFFQAQAEKRKVEKGAPSIIYAIEEPETSQHPNHQKIVVEALENLSELDGVQVLFTTHSSNLVREIEKSSLRYISKNDDDQLKIEYGVDLLSGEDNEQVIQRIIDTLGILPNPADRVKVLIYVEGNHDVNALKRYSKILNEHNSEIIDLSTSDQVGYVITGGSALKHYIEHKHLRGLGKPEVHVYDSDVSDYITAVNNLNAQNDPNIIAFNTSKTELENYLHHEAILDAYAENGISDLTLNTLRDDLDIPTYLAQCLCERNGGNWEELEPEKKKKLSSEKKKVLNTKAVDKMTIERLNERDSYTDLVTWLNAIKSFT
ncbi:ATP-binding protein [Reichenbachiella agariperforans]|uniref:ATP-binding protein n=1 Tax=Reichenbachiella agariperforans TaxID=156994 RepID=UPI001C0983F3|nr:ATP-binding protein [Reichenbachiella agariperforans]MBU2912911.1 ATP-binding protein [Reichenbachiella agariperforans]